MDDEIVQGAGCFGRGTLVYTDNGWKAIELVTTNDYVFGYDRFGELSHAKVSLVSTHTKAEFVDDLYFVYTEKGCVWPKGITGNHAVYDHITNTHKQIRDFVIGECLTDLHGNQIAITDIEVICNADIAEHVTVHNLTVRPLHTFIAGTPFLWVRVHNGAGGKQAQNMSTGVESPNTLQANSVAYVLDLISAGEIVGLNDGVNIAEGVEFNGTRVISPQGQQNFPGRILISGYYTTVYPRIEATKGTPDQPVLAGFTDIETTIYGQNQLVPYASGIDIRIIDSNKQAARVTLNFPNGLWQQYYSNGNITGFTVAFSILTKSDTASTWNTVYNSGLTGKTTSQYMVDYLIPAPAECIANPQLGWTIRVERNQPDDVISTTQATQSTFNVFSVTEILYQQTNYPNMAVVGLQVPAITVQNSIPTRGYYVTGLKVKVPSNYDPMHRTYCGSSLGFPVDPVDGTAVIYTGTQNAGSTIGYWDGSFKYAWTDNTAWILYDIIFNESYGLGKYLGQSVSPNIWSFYQASLYNDCTSWDYATKTYTKRLIPTGITNAIPVTSITIGTNNGNPVTEATCTIPNNMISANHSVTISGVTGPLASVLNGTFGVKSASFSTSTVVINIPSTTLHGTANNAGITCLDNSTNGFEYRFKFNAAITSQQDAWQLIQAIATNMHAVVAVINGQITVVQDRPKPISRMFNCASVINGLFTYSSTEVTSRTTAVNVTFNDINNFYMPKTVSEWDKASVAKYGYITNDIVAYGCVTEGQARRMARFALYTALDQYDMCSFGLALNVCDLTIGQVIATQDNFKERKPGTFVNGRIMSVVSQTTGTITFKLDRQIELYEGTYSFGVTAPDGANILSDNGTSVLQSYIYPGIVTNPVFTVTDYNNGTNFTNTVTIQFTDEHNANINVPTVSTWVNADFYAYNIVGGDTYDLWTVQSISEPQRGIFNVTCISYNTNKYGIVEQGLAFTPVLTPNPLLQRAVPAPGTITFQPVFTNTAATATNYLLISWTWDTRTFKDPVTFVLKYQIDNGNWVTIENITVPNYEIQHANPGVYNVIVNAVNIAGVVSPNAQNTYNYYVNGTSFNPTALNAGELQGTAIVTDSNIRKGTIVNTKYNATSLTMGTAYTVLSMGDVGNYTDFTLLGATGTGKTVVNLDGTVINVVAQGTQFTKNNITAHGTGTAVQTTSAIAAWDTQEYIANGHSTAIAVQFNPSDITGQFAVALDTSVTHTTIAALAYAFIFNAGTVTIEETNVTIAGVSQSYTANDIFQIAYTPAVFNASGTLVNNGTIKYFQTPSSTGVPVLLHTTQITTALTVYFNSLYYSPGTGISNLKLGVLTTSANSDLQPPVNLYSQGTANTNFTGHDIPIVWQNNYANSQAILQTFNNLSGTGLINTNQLTLLDITNVNIGETIAGNGVPVNTIVVGLNTTTKTLTLSNSLTSQAHGTYTFSVVVSTLLDYIVQVVNNGTVINTYTVTPNVNDLGGYFDYTYARNAADFALVSLPPQRNVTFRIFARDTLGNTSTTYTTATFTNPQAGGVSMVNIVQALDAVTVTITPGSEQDIAGYVICRGSASTFTGTLSSAIYNGADLSVTLNVPDSATYFYKVAAYDTFGTDNLTFSNAVSAAAITSNPTQWTLAGVTLSADAASHTLSWTAGTVYANGNGININAGSATWTSGTLYLYYPGSGNTLSSANNLGAAVGAGTFPIAAYTGGDITTVHGGTGDAFINGSSLIAGTVAGSAIVAGSIAAQQLSTSTAVITNTAQIANGVIQNANIGNTIQSNNFNNTTAYSGWKIDKNGDIISYGNLRMYTNTGNLLFGVGGVSFNPTAPATITWNGVPTNSGSNVSGVLTNNTANTISILTSDNSFSDATFSLAIPVGAYTAVGVDFYIGVVASNISITNSTNVQNIGVVFRFHQTGIGETCTIYYTNDSGITNSVSPVTWYNTQLPFTITIANGTITVKNGTTVNLTMTSSNGSYKALVATQNTSGTNIPLSFNALITATLAATQISGQITQTNASTYIASGAIGDAQIDRASVNALSVKTLDIQGNAVTVPAFLALANDMVGVAQYTWVDILSITVPSTTVTTRNILFTLSLNISPSQSVAVGGGYLWRVYNATTGVVVQNAIYPADSSQIMGLSGSHAENTTSSMVYKLQVYFYSPSSVYLNGINAYSYNKVLANVTNLFVMDVKR